MITPPTPPTTTNHLFEATKVRFNGFTGLSEEQEKAHISIEFTSLGHNWCLVIYPGGQSTAKEGMVSLFLQNQKHRNWIWSQGKTTQGIRLPRPCASLGGGIQRILENLLNNKDRKSDKIINIKLITLHGIGVHSQYGSSNKGGDIWT